MKKILLFLLFFSNLLKGVEFDSIVIHQRIDNEDGRIAECNIYGSKDDKEYVLIKNAKSDKTENKININFDKF